MASLSAPITALRQRFSSRKRRGVAGELDLGDPQVQLEQLGDRLRKRRESLDLTMRQLALDTRVSTPVIEALEKAWSDRLPEAAFLRTIIDKLPIAWSSMPVRSLPRCSKTCRSKRTALVAATGRSPASR